MIKSICSYLRNRKRRILKEKFSIIFAINKISNPSEIIDEIIAYIMDNNR